MNCVDEWKTIFDQTCQSSYRFDCRVPTPDSSYGQHVLDDLQQVYKYKVNSGVESEPYFPGNYEISNEEYEERLKTFKCKKEPHTRCYKTPRRVKIQNCKEIMEQKCQRVSNTNPRPVQHQTCHDEPYMECEVEKQYQLKIIQVPTYSEDCNEVPREICDNYGSTTIEQKCVNETKPVCEWITRKPICSKIPRQHCYKIPYQVKTTDCEENYKETIGIQNHGGYTPREEKYAIP